MDSDRCLAETTLDCCMRYLITKIHKWSAFGGYANLIQFPRLLERLPVILKKLDKWPFTPGSTSADSQDYALRNVNQSFNFKGLLAIIFEIGPNHTGFQLVHISADVR